MSLTRQVLDALQIEKTIRSRSFSSQKSAQARFNLNKFRRGKPFWEIRGTSLIKQNAKIIITDWSQQLKLNQRSMRTLNAILNYNEKGESFEMYAWVGKLVRIKSAEELYNAIIAIEPIHNSDLFKVLAEHNLSKDECKIIDVLQLQRLNELIDPKTSNILSEHTNLAIITPPLQLALFANCQPAQLERYIHSLPDEPIAIFISNYDQYDQLKQLLTADLNITSIAIDNNVALLEALLNDSIKLPSTVDKLIFNNLTISKEQCEAIFRKWSFVHSLQLENITIDTHPYEKVSEISMGKSNYMAYEPLYDIEETNTVTKFMPVTLDLSHQQDFPFQDLILRNVNLSDESFRIIFQKSPQLKKLVLDNNDATNFSISLSSNYWHTLIHCQELKSLTIPIETNDLVTFKHEASVKFPKLEYLNISQSFIPSTEITTTKPIVFENLKIDLTSAFTPVDKNWLLERPHLEILILRSIDDGVLDVHMPNVRLLTLYLISYTELPSDFLQKIKKNYPNLTELEITYQQLNIESVSAIELSVQSLYLYNISSRKHEDQFAVKMLQACRQIETLKLQAGENWILENGLQENETMFVNLHTIDGTVSGSAFKQLLTILRHTPNLEKLNIKRAQDIRVKYNNTEVNTDEMQFKQMVSALTLPHLKEILIDIQFPNMVVYPLLLNAPQLYHAEVKLNPEDIHQLEQAVGKNNVSALSTRCDLTMIPRVLKIFPHLTSFQIITGYGKPDEEFVENLNELGACPLTELTMDNCYNNTILIQILNKLPDLKILTFKLQYEVNFLLDPQLSLPNLKYLNLLDNNPLDIQTIFKLVAKYPKINSLKARINVDAVELTWLKKQFPDVSFDLTQDKNAALTSAYKAQGQNAGYGQTSRTSKPFSLDTDTAEQIGGQYENHFYPKESLPSDTYHIISVKNSVAMNETQIKLTEEKGILRAITPSLQAEIGTNSNDVLTYYRDHENDEGLFLCQATIKLTPDKPLSEQLPGLSLFEEIAAISEDCQLWYSDETRRYYVSAKEEDKAQFFIMRYLLKVPPQALEDLKTLYQPIPIDELKSKYNFNDDDLVNAILGLYISPKGLGYSYFAEQFFAKLNDFEKVSVFHYYFHHFFTAGELVGYFYNEYDVANAILHQAKGACRHRAGALSMLSQLGFTDQPCFFVESHPHAFVFLFDPITNNWIQSPFDLGGLPATFVKQPSLFDKPLDQLITTEVKTQKAETKTDDVDQDPNSPFVSWLVGANEKQAFNEFYEDLLQASTELPSHRRNVLLIIDDDEIDIFYQELSAYCKEAQSNWFIVNDLDNITLFESVVDVNGDLQDHPSELKHFLENGTAGDVFCVNWSSYKKSSHVGFNSIPGDDRKIKSFHFNYEILNLGIVSKSLFPTLPDDIVDRYKLIRECPKLSVPSLQLQLSRQTNDGEPAQIIFYNEDWEDSLYGAVRYTTEGFQYIPGQLQTLIESGVNQIDLINAPWHDAEFRIEILKLMNRHAITLNGQTLQLPETFTLASRNEQYHYQGPHFKFTTSSYSDIDFIIDQSTFEKAFEAQVFLNGKCPTIDGWLIQNKGKDIHILVTETLTEAQWAKLSHVAEMNQVHCSFTLAPGVRPPMQQAQAPQLAQQPMDERLIQTNDMGLTLKELKNTYPEAKIISVYPNISDADLVQNIVCIDQKNYLFREDLGILWQKLFVEENQMVILKGNFHPSLLNYLSTLFLPNPYLIVNGVKHTPKGKLILVSEQQLIPYITPVNHQYDEKDIRKKIYADFADAHPVRRRMAIESAFEFIDNCGIKINYTQLKNIVTQSLKLFGAKEKLSNPFKKFIRLQNNPKLMEFAEDLWYQTVEHVKEEIESAQAFSAARLAKVKRHWQGSPILFIAGDTATGKSTFVYEDLAQDPEIALYVGLQKVTAFLQNTDESKTPVLFFDEANLEGENEQGLGADPWEFLEGMFDDPPSILYQGVLYPIKNHKIIFVGNYLTEEGRVNYEFLQRHGQTINFKQIPLPVIREAVAKHLHNANIKVEHLNALIDIFMSAYQQFKGMTPRNMKMCILSFAASHDYSLENAVKVCISEMSKKRNEENQQAFINSITQATNITLDLQKVNEPALTPVMRSERFHVTESRKPVLMALHQHLSVRAMIQATPSLKQYQVPGLILEGGSGQGKTNIVIEFVKSLGYVNADTKTSPTDAARYYYIQAGDLEEMEEKLIKAFHEGALVIIDEINSLPLEDLLNRLLSGVDRDGKPANTPGFLLIGTQNPISFGKRQKQSTPLINRCNKQDIPDYTDDEIIEVSYKVCPDKIIANQLIKRYFTDRNYAINHKKPHIPTPRKLFDELRAANLQHKPNFFKQNVMPNASNTAASQKFLNNKK